MVYLMMVFVIHFQAIRVTRRLNSTVAFQLCWHYVMKTSIRWSKRPRDQLLLAFQVARGACNPIDSTTKRYNFSQHPIHAYLLSLKSRPDHLLFAYRRLMMFMIYYLYYQSDFLFYYLLNFTPKPSFLPFQAKYYWFIVINQPSYQVKKFSHLNSLNFNSICQIKFILCLLDYLFLQLWYSAYYFQFVTCLTIIAFAITITLFIMLVIITATTTIVIETITTFTTMALLFITTTEMQLNFQKILANRLNLEFSFSKYHLAMNFVKVLIIIRYNSLPTIIYQHKNSERDLNF